MIIHGDCIEQMKQLPENSVDAIVTDPPYGLAFMGKEWDNFSTRTMYKFFHIWAIECLRVLKPGGFLLAFGGTRTYHRLACGIEDAGFEIRDCIQWLYGSGFPKSLNIGKQIDKIQGNERGVVGKDKGKSYVHQNKVNVEQGFRPNNYYKDNDGSFDITKGNSEWEGWGTALKPANEPIVVARKPLSEKNVALNVLKWRTGGINIDACRIGFSDNDDLRIGKGYEHNAKAGLEIGKNKDNQSGNKQILHNNQGRFPANIILDEEAGKMLDEQSGNKTGAFAPVKQAERSNNVYGKYDYFGDNGKTFRGDKGGASRFFYCAKASKSERNFGCEEFEDKRESDRNKDDGIGGENPRNRSNTPKKNHHPTVKPIKLMEYLIKLVSKEGATILDPFVGSGTTGCAAIKLNRKFIGIEREEEYIRIAEARIKANIPEQQTLFNTNKNHSPQLNSELPKARFEAGDALRGKEKKE